MIDIIRHKIVLTGILRDIYTDTLLSPVLGFKGGTAIHLLHGLPRFSVDLDFNLMDIRVNKEVMKKVVAILEKYGAVKEATEKRQTLFFLLSYEKKMQNVKVEISKRIFHDDYEVMNFLGIPLLVMKRGDMFAHKLTALLERKDIANRDIYDIWFFMKNRWDVNLKLVEIRTKLGFENYLKQCIARIKKVDNRYILQGLGELLDEKQKIWVKENLKDEILLLMNLYINQ